MAVVKAACVRDVVTVTVMKCRPHRESLGESSGSNFKKKAAARCHAMGQFLKWSDPCALAQLQLIAALLNIPFRGLVGLRQENRSAGTQVGHRFITAVLLLR